MNDVLIRGTPQRKWFIDGYLIPALLDAGVPKKKIHLYMDTARLGNLGSFLALEDVLPTIASKSVWHLQDDVYPVSNFANRCEELEEICGDGIIFGFWPRNQRAIPEGQPGHIRGFGLRSNKDWQLWSFQCIMIPTAIAIDGIKWIRENGEKKCFPKSNCGDLQSLYDQNKGDDSLFFTYLENVLPDKMHYDCEWSLVDHVGGMIGGSLLGNRIGRATRFIDKAKVDAFEEEWKTIARRQVLDYLEKLGVDRTKVKF